MSLLKEIAKQEDLTDLPNLQSGWLDFGFLGYDMVSCFCAWDGE